MFTTFNLSRHCACFGLALILFVPRAIAQTPEIEPNNNPTNGTLVVMEPVAGGFIAAMSGAIQPAGDVDYYQIVIPPGAPLGWLGWFYVDTGGQQLPGANSRNCELYLLDASGAVVLESDDNDGTGNGGNGSVESLEASVISGVPLLGGIYYLAVTGVAAPGVAARINPYTLFAAVTPAPTPVEVEPNGTPALALANPPLLPFAPGPAVGSVSGMIAGPPPPLVDLPDLFAVPAMAGDVLHLNLDCDPGRVGSSDLTLTLFDPAGIPLLTANSSAPPFGLGNPSAEGFSWRVTLPGIYFVGVALVGPPGVVDDYVLTVARHPVGTLGFGLATVCVEESAGLAPLTVNRTGGSYGTVSVDFATTNLTALAGVDYVATNGTLVFSNGVFSQSFTVPILDDGVREMTESFGVVLGNPSNYAGLGPITTTIVGIVDNDQANDDSPATATALDLTTGIATAIGAISPAGDADYYTFTAPAGARVSVLVDTGGAQPLCADSRDSLLTLLASDGTTVIESDDNDGSGNDGTSENFPGGENASAIAGRLLTAGGTYFIRVEAAGGTAIIDPYKLFVVLCTNTPVAEVEPNSQPQFAVVLNGAQVVPPNGSTATGSGGIILFRDNAITYDISYRGLTGDFAWPLGAHLHGPAGFGQNTSEFLQLNAAPSGTRAGRLQGGTATLMAAQVAALKAGSNYVDIHSAAFPMGEIRGQVVFQPASFSTANYMDLSSQPMAVRSGAISSWTDFDDYSFLAPPGSEILVWFDLDPERDFAQSDLMVDLLADDGATPLFQAELAGAEGTNSLGRFSAEGFHWTVPNTPPGGVPGLRVFFLRVWPYPARTGTYQLTVAVKSPGQFTFESVRRNPCAGVDLVNENAGVATINVARTFGNFGPVTVDFATRDVTALAGSDYVATNGTLTFASGQTRAGFNVTILDDSEPEAIEGLGLDLVNPTGGAIVDQSVYTCPNSASSTLNSSASSQLLILDNDAPRNDSTTNAMMLDVSLPVAEITGNLAVFNGHSLDVIGFTNSTPGARAWIYASTYDPTLSPYASGDSIISLWRSNFAMGNLIESDDDHGSQGPLSSAIAGRVLTNTGNYYIAVNVFDPASGVNKAETWDTNTLPLFNYRLSVVLTTSMPVAEAEPNDTPAQANPIVTSNSPVGIRSATLSAAQVDFYSVVAERGDTLIVMADGNPERDFASCQTDTTLSLLGPDGTSALLYADSSGCGGDFCPAEAFRFPVPASGNYFVRVALGSHNQTSSTYQLLVARERPFMVTPTITGGNVTLSFPTLPGRNYQVEVSTDLRTWSPLSGVLAGTGGTVTFTDPGVTGTTLRFYRLAMLP